MGQDSQGDSPRSPQHRRVPARCERQPGERCCCTPGKTLRPRSHHGLNAAPQALSPAPWLCQLEGAGQALAPVPPQQGTLGPGCSQVPQQLWGEAGGAESPGLLGTPRVPESTQHHHTCPIMAELPSPQDLPWPHGAAAPHPGSAAAPVPTQRGKEGAPMDTHQVPKRG